MGFTYTRSGRDGKPRYVAFYRDLRGRQRSAGTFSTKRDSNRAWQRAETDIAVGRIGDRRRGKQRLAGYVQKEWFPNRLLEASTRQTYSYLLDRYILPSSLGDMRMVEILPSHIREWVNELERDGVNPPTIKYCKVIVDAIFTTALNDQMTFLHPGKGVKTPPVAKKPLRVITAEQFDAIYDALDDDTMQLLMETDIETGLRWGELTELRVNDIDLVTGVLTVSRVVVELNPKFHPEGRRFLVKYYPKDKEWRQLRIADHLVNKIRHLIDERTLGRDDLLFELHQRTEPRRRVPVELPDPEALGWTEPNEKGRVYRHGTLSAYVAGRCRCRPCKDVMAVYRASRRSAGKDQPRTPRQVDTDGHIGRNWFRRNVWLKALDKAQLGFHVTPNGLRHAHASWLLAGGADIQVVKERLGHGSITTTERYLHTYPKKDDAALNALARIRPRKAA